MDRTVINITDPETEANFENAAEAVASEMDAPLATGRGRPKKGELTRSDVLNELAVAYTGHDAGGD